MCPGTTFAVRTFGCKVNQYDSQLLAEQLSALGLQSSDGPEGPSLPARREGSLDPSAVLDDRGSHAGVQADGEDEAVAGARQPDAGGAVLASNRLDLVVVNTCAVTARSEAKGRRLVRWLLRRYPQATIVLTGCAVRLDVRPWQDIARQAEPGRLLVAASPDEVPRRLVEVGLVETRGLSRESLATGAAPHPARISGFLGHDRAFVKVQDGCQAFCSYCVVPLVRPLLWSKPADAVVEEVRALSEAGYGEVVLVGVHLGLYGGEASACATPDLAGLIRRLLAETDVGRLRLSSIEPQEVTDDLIDLVAGSDRLCPHFHLPLQSGDASVLRAMNRRYTVREYLGTLERIAQKIPRPAFTTDILLGFPGEGEAEFARTLSAVREARFSRIHAFRYSPRPGTKAAALRGRAPEREVLHREHALLALAGELARSYRNQFLGEVVEVLVEGSAGRLASPTCRGGVVAEPKTREFITGLSERYLRVRFPHPEGARLEGARRPGSLLRVRVVAADEVGLVGEWKPEDGG